MRRQLTPLIFPVLLAACHSSSYPYERQDAFYIDGIRYTSDIASVRTYATGFSPDIGSRRVDTTPGGDNVYRITLPNNAGIWVTDAGPLAKEDALKSGADFVVKPDAVFVDNLSNPTHWHAISVRCDGEEARKECYEDAHFRILSKRLKNKQEKADINWEFRSHEDSVVRVFSQMKYYVCPETAWKNSKHLSQKFSSAQVFTVSFERQHQNSYTAGEALMPCNTKAVPLLLNETGEGGWAATPSIMLKDFRYVGKTTIKEISDFFNSGFEKENSLFFRSVKLPSGKEVNMSPEGLVTLAFDPADRNIYILGINEYRNIEFSRDQ